MAVDRLGVTARIKQAREAAGISQEEMADLLNVRARTYNNYEAQSPERARVPFRFIEQIAEFTGTRPEWLLYGSEEPAGKPANEEGMDRLKRIEALLEAILERLGVLTGRGEGESDQEQIARGESGLRPPPSLGPSDEGHDERENRGEGSR